MGRRRRPGRRQVSLDGPTAEMEILRGDLARLLFEAARGHAAFRFGDRVERVDEDEGE